jgi:hypothetical protein
MAIKKSDLPTPKNWPKRVKMEVPTEDGIAVVDCTREQFFNAFRKAATLIDLRGVVKVVKK